MVDREIDILWRNLEIQPLKKAVKHLLPFGKRVRSVLALLAHGAVGGDCKKLAQLAAVIEGLHAASLIQDDLIDCSSIRRGVESVHKKFGTPLAILASDYLIFRSYDILLKTCKILKIPENLTVEVFNTLNKTLISCTFGQSTELERTGFNTSLEEYRIIIESKTAKQFEASAYIGSVLGGANEQQIRILSEFGRYIGVAHQIKDDILDIIGEKRKIGKELLKDFQQKEFLNYVCLIALEHNTSEFIKKIKEGLASNSLNNLIKDYLIERGYIKRAEKDAKELVNTALKMIENADLENKKELRLLSEYIVKRES